MGANCSTGPARQFAADGCARALGGRKIQADSSSSAPPTPKRFVKVPTNSQATTNEGARKAAKQGAPGERAAPAGQRSARSPKGSAGGAGEPKVGAAASSSSQVDVIANATDKKPEKSPESAGRTDCRAAGEEGERRGAKEAAERKLDEREAQQRAEKLKVLKEGVDFIENEEDVEAVESAVVKIQSTFRGKKIRSRLAGKPSEAAAMSQDSAKGAQGAEAAPAGRPVGGAEKAEEQEKELSGKVAEMQVNEGAAEAKQANKATDEEATRAATKIQANYKGYKRRKELEGKLAAGSSTEAPEEAAQPDR